MKKKKEPANAKRGKPAAKPAYPDTDPEWEHLEERYSQIGDEMRKLAELLGK